MNVNDRIKALLAAALALLAGVSRSVSAGVERITAAAAQGASVARGALLGEHVNAGGRYTFECIGPDGQVKWRDEIQNTVVTVGKNDLLDKYLAGSSYTATWFLGLIDLTSYSAISAADTAASHAGWVEAVPYSNSTRPAPSWNAASAGSKASTATAFNINATATVKGAFLISNSTKSGTTGTLYSAGLFSGGDRAVASGDTLNVTYTASA